MDLISHINGDGDLVGAWLAQYTAGACPSRARSRTRGAR